MKFALAEFEENKIAVVPETWLDAMNKMCRWPKARTTERITAAVNRGVDPEENWDSYAVVRIFGKYDTALEARSKAKIFEIQSDAGTDNGKIKRSVSMKIQDPPLPPSKVSKKSKIVKRPKESSSGSSESDSESIPSLPDLAITANDDAGLCKFSPSTSLPNHPTDLASHSRVTSPLVTMTLTSRTIGQARFGNPDVEAQDFLSNTGFQEVISSLAFIKIQLRDLVAAQTIMQKQLNSSAKVSNFTKNISLPFLSVKDLEDLEAKVSAEESYNTELANLLDNIGGRDVRNCTFVTMKKLMSNAVASRLNWKGRNEKISFEKSNLCDIVANCVMYQFEKKEGTFIEVKKAIQDWLKAAKQRMKQSAHESDLE